MNHSIIRRRITGIYLMLSMLMFLVALGISSTAQGAGVRSTQETWQQHFALGSQSFKAGDYTAALQAYDRAYALASRHGKPGATLLYNRAITLHKLRRYQDAIAAFSLLVPPKGTAELTADEQQWADLGRYNLGLIARDQQHIAEARRLFTELQQARTNQRLRELARRQLAALPPISAALTPTATTTSSALLSIGLIRDDNASSLADEPASALSTSEDTYLNFLGYGQYYVAGRRTRGTKVYGLLQARRYQEYASFDSDVLGAGVAAEFTPSTWTYELGGRMLQSHLDSHTLSNQYTVLTRAITKRDNNRGQWEWGYQGSFIDAGSNFAYIDGWQHQIKLTRHQLLGNVTVTPSLSWETNDRDNRTTAENFYSYSPDILTASLGIRWEITPNWRLYTQLERADADYSGTNKLVDLGREEKAQSRRYQRTQWLLGARYKIASRWSLKGEYNSAKTDDNFALYSYDKRVLSLKLDYGW